MSKSRTLLIGVVAGLFVNIIGWKYITSVDGANIMLFEMFLITCVCSCISVTKQELKKCLLPLFLIAYWCLHMSLAFFHVCIVGTYSIWQISFCLIWLIVATFLTVFGVKFGIKLKTRSFSISQIETIPNGVYYSLLLIYTMYMIARFYFAGGIRNYTFSDYQFKIPETLQTLFFILRLTMSGFDYLNLVFVVKSGKLLITKVARLFFVFSMLNVFISGGSTGILFLLVSLMALLILKAENRDQVRRYFRIAIPVVVIGAYVGVLIRFNRQDYTNFSFNVLDDAMDTVCKSATFDCLENFIRIVRDFDPQYSLGQLIYPLVNWMPRSIFPWKPTELGNLISREYHNFAVGSNAGFATSPMGDFYYDMGYMGIVFGVFGVGCFIGLLQTKLNRLWNSTDVTLWLLINIMYIISTYPNWYTGFGVRMFYLWVFALLLKVLCRIFNARYIANE